MTGAAVAAAAVGAGISGGISAATSGGGGAAKASKADIKYNNYLRNLQQTNLNGAQSAAYNPANWAAYSGQRVADLTTDQKNAFKMIRANAGDTTYTGPAGNQVLDTLGGKYFNHSVGANPYMGNSPSTLNPYMGNSPSTANQYMGNGPSTENQYLGSQTSVVTNPMLGLDSPYLNNAIQTAQNDVSRNYNRTIAPQTDANFARAGAFGGSAWADQTGENNRQLAQELGRVDSNMRMQDYSNQQNLQQANAQMLTGVNQSDLTRNAGLAGQGIVNNMSQWGTNANLANQQIANNLGVWNSKAGMANNQIGNDISIWGTNSNMAQNQIGLNEQAYQAERARQTQAVPQALAVHNQGYTDAGQLLAAGNQQQAQEQAKIQALMDYYQQNQQAQLAPYTYMNSLIQQPSAQTPVGSYTNPWAAGLGGAIMGAQAGAGLYNYGQGQGWWGSTPTSAPSTGTGISSASSLGSGVQGWQMPWSGSPVK